MTIAFSLSFNDLFSVAASLLFHEGGYLGDEAINGDRILLLEQQITLLNKLVDSLKQQVGWCCSQKSSHYCITLWHMVIVCRNYNYVHFILYYWNLVSPWNCQLSTLKKSRWYVKLAYMPHVPDFPGSSRILTCVPESVPDAKNVPEIKKTRKKK